MTRKMRIARIVCRPISPFAIGRARAPAVAAALAIGTLAAACSQPRAPIVVQQAILSLENQTRFEWTAIEIWVNDHYRVTAPSLAAGGRLDVPLGSFVAGFGQRFDRFRQGVFGVEVTAKSAGGDAVRLTWGKGRRR